MPIAVWKGIGYNQDVINPHSTNRGRISVPAKMLFDEFLKEGTFGDQVRDIYYSPASTQERLSQANIKLDEQYRDLLAQAVKEGALSPEQAESKAKSFTQGDIGPWNPSRGTVTGETLQSLRELEDTQFCLNRVPQQSGDGLYRPMDFYTSAGALKLIAQKQNWEMKTEKNGEEIPVADAVVVGGGPGGLTSAWQLARRGGRVVCFESELAGSAFSDNTAKSVHHMRTSVNLTNLVREGFLNEGFTRQHPLSLHGQIAEYRSHAKAGRDSQLELTGSPIHGVPPESLDLQDEHSPATRGELFEHLASLSYSLANDYPNAILSERSPVDGITFEDGLYTVTTTRGHKVKAKHLVLATGLTGPQGERGRMLPVFETLFQAQPERYTLLGKDGDSLRERESLESLALGTTKGGLIFNDRLLGDQAVRQTIASYPEGTRAAVIGSGESAIKGALELLHLHPGLKVDLFVKDTLEAAQVQLPIENFHSAVLETTLEDPKAIAAAEDTFRVFDTPVTPRSLQELFEFQQSGRARIVEMGGYFDEESMELTPLGDGNTKLSIRDAAMAQTVSQRSQEYRAKNLMPQDAPGIDGSEYQIFVQSVGYRKLPDSENPLLQLGPEAQLNLHINTAGSAVHPAQTSMPGLSTKGRHLAERIAQDIPEERRVHLEQHESWGETEAETVQGIIVNRGLHPGFVRNVKKAIEQDGSHPQELRLTFTSDDTRLRDLARIPKEQRSPAEQETLERGYLLAEKMKKHSEGL